MKKCFFPSRTLILTGACLLTALPALRAQTTTTTTTVIPGTNSQTQVQTTQVETVQPAPAEVIVPQPGQHVAEIEVIPTRGSIQAYFGRAPKGEKLEVGSAELSIKLPSTATVTKLASRDKDSDGPRRITAANPWRVSVPFNGPGRYVFNLVEWDDDALATVVLKVDGVVLFAGQGRSDDLDDWSQKTYGANVRKTGSREIAFVIAP